MHPLKKEFIEMFEASGWSQADIARKLELTPGGVSSIIKGDHIPSMTTVKLFRLILLGEKPDVRFPTHQSKASVLKDDGIVSSRPSGWENEVIKELDDLAPDDRSKVIDALKAIVKIVPKRRPTRSSEAKRVA
jgi:transcriptional regulator with XRE-family HTH domain